MACSVEDPQPAGINAQYVLASPESVTAPTVLRYEVIWMGPEAYESTNHGVVTSPDQPFTVRFDLPSQDTLGKVHPQDTLSYNFHSLPEPAARRPRLVVYEDLNGNSVFNIAEDRIVAIDGAGYDRYSAIIAIVNLNAFLSELTPDEHTIYYGWTRDEYTAFIYAGASQYWSSRVYPIFENAYLDDEVANKPNPVMVLLAESDAIMREDLLCYRDVTRVTQQVSKEMWVDAALDAAKICDETDILCFEFDGATATPDIDGLSDSADEFYTACGWSENGEEIIQVYQGQISCSGCYCETTWYITWFMFHANNIPVFPTCAPDTPLPDISALGTTLIDDFSLAR